MVLGVYKEHLQLPVTTSLITTATKPFEKLNFVWTANRDPASCAYIVVIYQSGGI